MSDSDLLNRSIYRIWTKDIVRYSDLDPNGHVNNGAINQYFEDGRIALRNDYRASPIMKLRRFGQTGLEVSEVAFGGGRSGGILIDADENIRYDAVRRAIDLGVNWFDTAPPIR